MNEFFEEKNCSIDYLHTHFLDLNVLRTVLISAKNATFLMIIDYRFHKEYY